MKTILIKQALACLNSSGESEEPLNLYGLIRKNEDLSYVLSIGREHPYLPVIGKVGVSLPMSYNHEIFGLIDKDDIRFFYRERDQWTEADKIVVDLADSYKRTPFPSRLMEKLRQSVVTIFGIGSGGSRLSVGLARDGVMNFRLVDPDVFSIENVSRHECSLLDLNRYKVEAVKERILTINPMARVETSPFDVFKVEKAVRNRVFNGSDLVIASTDRRTVQLKINDDCVRRKIVALYTGCYDEARGGELLFVVPGETDVCYECLRGGSRQSERRRKYDYSRARDDQEYEGEPALNAAINLITDVAEHYAIALLLREEECEMARLIDPKRNLLFVGGALGAGFYYLKGSRCFKRPFEFVFPVVKGPWEDCEAHKLCKK